MIFTVRKVLIAFTVLVGGYISLEGFKRLTPRSMMMDCTANIEHRRIVFFKVVESATMLNILYKFALSRQMIIMYNNESIEQYNIKGNNITQDIKYITMVQNPSMPTSSHMNFGLNLTSPAIIDKMFDFVLVSDYFEESLVMLKRLMGWSLKDILFLNRETTTTTTTHNRQRAPIDYVVYSYFLHVFKKKMKLESCNFEGEVDMFKQMLKKINTFCSKKNGMNFIIVGQTMWSKAFGLTRNDCISL